MTSRSVPLGALLLLIALTAASAQDTVPVIRSDTVQTATDSVRANRARSLGVDALEFGRRSLRVARRGEQVVFGADSAVADWTGHDDAASRAMRKLSPIAFWVPIAAVATTPLVWIDETRDRHALNAQYAESATAALAMGFVLSRTTKHFIHRARPCTGEPPADVFVGSTTDSLPNCPRGSGVGGYSSFFSEHTMALFAIASAATFQAQRQNDPHAASVAAIAFTGASVFSIGRIYQRHHWLSDVLVGAAVGTASGALAAQLGPAKPRGSR
jgi:membrane-associated phospholipid phosphatase